MNNQPENPGKVSLPRIVIVLGFVSLFMDIASEMLYPVAPLFLATVVGAPIVWIGIIEGIAEAVAGLSKGYFGALSDAKGRRKPFITLGYGLAALSKPIPGLSATITAMLGSRVLDKIGKGIRTTPRDALIAHHTPKEIRGAAFGFHRAMDSLGAAIGPALALIYLQSHPKDYSTLFLNACVPALLATLTTMFAKERTFSPTESKPGLRASFRFWKESPPLYRRGLILLTLFAFVNSSDAFLILRSKQLGLSDVQTIIGYIAFNVLYALTAFPAGKLSDRFGHKRILSLGMVAFSIVYIGFAYATGSVMVWAMFGFYSLYAAMTEGVAKAWISDLVPNERRGLGLGLVAATGSLGCMLASFWTGVVWDSLGSSVPLVVSAVVAGCVGVGVLLLRGVGSEQVRKGKGRLLRVCIYVPIMLLGGIMVCDRIVENYADKYVYSNIDSLPENKVGLVLGTSKNRSSGSENLFYKKRMDCAAELWKAHKVQFLIVSGDNRLDDFNEPQQMKESLIERGVPADHIWKDEGGARTLGSILNARDVFHENAYTIISQDFHNRRAIYLARHIGMNAIAFNAPEVEGFRGVGPWLRERFARVRMFVDILLEDITESNQNK